ncbi:MAG: hypothetical protein M3M96_04045 [Candidatus Eremiobacteraeota bacterium]|nr:hypothetical protein [Candidatus Eremiobacteraeota bacterium]
MRAKIAAYAVSASAILYASTVFGYSEALRSSSGRSALLERASVENNLLLEGTQMEVLQSRLASKLRRLTVVTDSRGSERLLQRVALVARRSHVEITGLVPDAGESKGSTAHFYERGMAIRLRARFADALTFVRLLPAAGILLRIRDVAFTEHQDSRSSSALDVMLRITLLQPAGDWLQESSP